MIYEPNKLSEYKEQFEKKEKRIGTFVGIFLVVPVSIYILITSSLVNSVLNFWLFVLGGSVIVSVLYFLISYIVLEHRDRLFIQTNNAIVKKYNENHDAILFYKRLFDVEEKPKTMYALMCWYMNVVVAMCLNDKINEAIQLIEQLDLIATKTEKKLLEKHKVMAYEMLEKKDKNDIE